MLENCVVELGIADQEDVQFSEFLDWGGNEPAETDSTVIQFCAVSYVTALFQ